MAAWKPLSNRTAHLCYGNRGKSAKALLLAAWNSGNAYLENKQNEIENVIESELFRSIRNTVTRSVKKEKELWQKGKMEIYQANSADCWKNIMGWLGWASTGSPTKLYSGGRVETSPNKMANIMNEYYVKKVANIRASLPPPTEDPLARLRMLMAGSTAPVFDLQPVHPDLVDKIIQSLKNSKASGLDNINTCIIKQLFIQHALRPAK